VRLQDAVLERRLVHPDHPDLNRHVRAAIACHSRRGWRIDRAGRGDDHVDAVVALAMALDRAEQKPQPVALLGSLL
jgi:phage terminase large subunit-like protein